MQNKLLNLLRQAYKCLYDVNGNDLLEPIGVIKSASTNYMNIDRLKTILQCLVVSDNISDVSKMYIVNSNMSLSDINRELNYNKYKEDSRKKDSCYHVILKKVKDDKDKLSSILTHTLITDMIYNEIDEEIADKIVDSIIANYGQCLNVRNKLDLNIEQTRCEYVAEEDRDDFFNILNDIGCYLTKRKEIIEQALNNDDNFVKYFNYLLSSDALHDDRVRTDRLKLMRFLANQEIDDDIIA